MTGKTYKIHIDHVELRREVDNYLNHAKANGFDFKGYGALSSYVQLVELVMRIEFEKQYTREVKND